MGYLTAGFLGAVAAAGYGPIIGAPSFRHRGKKKYLAEGDASARKGKGFGVEAQMSLEKKSELMRLLGRELRNYAIYVSQKALNLNPDSARSQLS